LDIVPLLILWAVIASAVALAVLVPRRRSGDGEPPDYRVVLGFVGTAYGLLLGLLVVTAVGHFSDARHKAEDEATSLVALSEGVTIFPPEVRVLVQHDLICYMRSIVADDWPSMESGNTTEAPRTLAFGDRVRSDIRTMPFTNQRESAAFGRVSGLITDANKARQDLLFFTQPEIPTLLWVVIYVGVFLMVFVIAIHYTDHPGGRAPALGMMSVLLTVVIAVIATLDRPFDLGAQVQPNAMRQAITLLSVNAGNGVLRSCSARPHRY
jgi:hypothetical protein